MRSIYAKSQFKRKIHWHMFQKIICRFSFCAVDKNALPEMRAANRSQSIELVDAFHINGQFILKLFDQTIYSRK